MKFLKVVGILSLMLFSRHVFSQTNYTVNGETLTLIEEVKGELTLYYAIVNSNYRYFVKKNSEIIELNNTKVGGKFQMEFRKQLEDLTENTNLYTSRVNFALYSLETFVNDYNESQDKDYERNDSTINISARLGLFGGLTNNIYTSNPENVVTPKIGMELELIDPNIAPRHAVFFHLQHYLKGDTQDVSSTQFSINYRYRFILKRAFDIHADLELASFAIVSQDVNTFDDMGMITGDERETSSSLDSPISFSIGSDIRVSENGFLTLSYNDFYSLVFDDNGEFPIDFTLGYKVVF